MQETVRWLFGGVFILSSITKVFNDSYMELYLKGMSFPETAISYLAVLVPLSEFSLGFMIVLDVQTAIAFVISIVSLTVYAAFLLFGYYAIGNELPCGCFGGLFTLRAPQEILLDGVLIAMAAHSLAVIQRRPERLLLDKQGRDKPTSTIERHQ